MSLHIFVNVLGTFASYLPKEAVARKMFARYSIMDSAAIVKKVTASPEFNKYGKYVATAIGDMDDATVGKALSSFLGEYYPSIIDDVAGDEKITRKYVEVVTEVIKEVRTLGSVVR